VWSTDEVDVADPFQRNWLLKQILTHGTAEDIRRLDLNEVAEQIDHLQLPADIERLWRASLNARNG
jgi:ribosomal protein L9